MEASCEAYNLYDSYDVYHLWIQILTLLLMTVERAQDIVPLSISSNSDSTMATIKKADKAGAKQSYVIIFAVVAAILFAFGAFSMASGGNDSIDGLGKAGLRLPNDKQTAGSKEHEIEDGGRLITFELAKLKAGASGTITIRTRPSWAPIGVGRFHELVESGFFNECRFFRVVNNFIVQFGISVCIVSCLFCINHHNDAHSFMWFA